MTRKTTAILMALWLLCQQAVAGVTAYTMIQPMSIDHGANTDMRCQESNDTISMHHTLSHQTELRGTTISDAPSSDQHHSSHRCCNASCQCCVGNCATHFVMNAQAPHFQEATQQLIHEFKIEAPIQVITSLFRPPILS